MVAEMVVEIEGGDGGGSFGSDAHRGQRPKKCPQITASRSWLWR